MNKKKRQQVILRLISEYEVETQHQLCELLSSEGISVGQATLSRDIRELKIRKRLSENDVMCYMADGVGKPFDAGRDIGYNVIFAQSVISMDSAQNIVVLKCHAGLADAACKVVDEQKLDLVIGTIAGDDTVFILTADENHAMSLISILKRLRKRI